METFRIHALSTFWLLALLTAFPTTVSAQPGDPVENPQDDGTAPLIQLLAIDDNDLSGVTATDSAPLILEMAPFETYSFRAVANDASGVSKLEVSLTGAEPDAGDLLVERDIGHAIDRLETVVSVDFQFGRHLVLRAIAEDYHGNRAETPAIVVRAPFHVYVVNHLGTTDPQLPTVSVIDPASNTVIGGFFDNSVGPTRFGNPICAPRCGGSVHDVEYAGSGVAVVTHAADVWAYKMRSGTLSAVYDARTPEHPNGLDGFFLAIPPNGKKAFVANLLAGTADHISVLDLTDNTKPVHNLD